MAEQLRIPGIETEMQLLSSAAHKEAIRRVGFVMKRPVWADRDWWEDRRARLIGIVHQAFMQGVRVGQGEAFDGVQLDGRRS